MPMKEKETVAVSDLHPKQVFHFFEEISRIPRPSYHERAISDYLAQFAKERGLFYRQDEKYNVVIIKEASQGYEHQPPLVLQGHMDMVCEKESGCTKDLMREGPDLETDGEYVWAKGTTLGGDDGIAIAYALAILDAEDIPHPRLEFLCTVCEEVGMEGADALDLSDLKGRQLLNLDSEEEGIFLAGCAGGCTADIRWTEETEQKTGKVLELQISGLLGGHSGTEIDKGRANANMLMTEWLGRLYERIPFGCIAMEGGSKDNAIPRNCISRIAVQGDSRAVSDVQAAVEQIAAEMRRDWQAAEPGIQMQCSICKEEMDLGDRESCAQDTPQGWMVGMKQTEMLLKKLGEFPNGVISMCQEPEGLVETSLNLGILKVERGAVRLRYSLRSCVDRELVRLTGQLGEYTKRIGAIMELSGKYPAWEYQKNSVFRDRLAGIYAEMFGREPQIQVIHAGVECGILAAKLPGLECVSLGPDIYDIHTPMERMSVKSVERMYEFLLELLCRKAE